MRIDSLTLRNWEVHEDFECEFKVGVIGIIGRNGSGKSSILRAIAFALLGELQGFGVKADYLRHGAKEGFVTVRFSHGGESFELKRYIHLGKQVLSCGTKRWTRNDEIIKIIEDATGSSADALVNNIFIPQGQLDSVFTAPPTERMREFQRTFALNKVETAYTALGVEISRHRITPGLPEQVADCMQALATIASDKQALVKQVDDIELELTELRPLEQAYNKVLLARTTLQTLAEAERLVVEATGEHKKISDEVEAEAQRLATLKASLDSVQELAAHAQAQLNDMAAARLRHKQCQVYREQLRSLPSCTFDHNELTQLEALLASADDAHSSAKAATLHRTYLQAPDILQAQALVAEAQRLKAMCATFSVPTECSIMHSKLNEIEGHMTTFASGACPTCGQAVKDHDPAKLLAERDKLRQDAEALLQQAKAEWERRNAEATTLLTFTQQRVDELVEKAAQEAQEHMKKASSAAAETRAAYEACLMRKRQYEQMLDKRAHLERSIQELATDELPSEEAEQGLTQVLAQYKTLQTQLTALETSLSVKQAVLGGATARLTRAVEARERIGTTIDIPPQEVVESLKAAAEKVSARTQSQRALLDRLAILDVKLVEHEASYRRLSDQLAKEEKLISWLDICTRARAAVHPNGLPALLMREYTAVLNRRIQKYLSLWDAPFKLYLDDNMAFMAQYSDGCAHSAARLSGGQKIVASASFRLAMADTFASRAGMIVLDEPSVYLDSDSIIYLQKLLLKLKEYSGAAGKQVFLVTHEQSLAGFFDHIIRVHRTH